MCVEPVETLSGPITTRRLVLRAPQIEDAHAIAEYANDRHVAEMTGRIPHPFALADALDFLGNLGEEWVALATDRQSGAFRGVLGLRSLDERGRIALGYWLGRPFWGQGLATEAAQAVIDHAFRHLGAEIVEARCRVVNAASRRVVQRCGFQYVGTSMDISLAAGRVASETYRMDRRCWQALKEWGTS